jgi:hypothetical protein
MVSFFLQQLMQTMSGFEHLQTFSKGLSILLLLGNLNFVSLQAFFNLLKLRNDLLYSVQMFPKLLEDWKIAPLSSVKPRSIFIASKVLEE